MNFGKKMKVIAYLEIKLQGWMPMWEYSLLMNERFYTLPTYQPPRRKYHEIDQDI